MDELKALVAVFGPVGGMALLGCWFLWRALNRRTDQLVDLGKASAEAMTRLADTEQPLALSIVIVDF